MEESTTMGCSKPSKVRIITEKKTPSPLKHKKMVFLGQSDYFLELNKSSVKAWDQKYIPSTIVDQFRIGPVKQVRKSNNQKVDWAIVKKECIRALEKKERLKKSSGKNILEA